ncbi:MAG: winged helix-turn-helix transcriptional regulator [Nitrososphaerota archaeon]|jgi:Mn-dependent DtxR family transcriptional regulator|nr:winged helix-turn-helix transcriptional regulator [Nitrososphaerota archaeon]
MAPRGDAKVTYRPSRGKRGAQAALEDYVEMINHLIKEKGFASQAEIAERLGVSPPSVTSMLRKLRDKGYVIHERYRGVSLTENGKKLAERMEVRHIMLAEFLTVIGVDKKTAYEDAENIEHYLHPATVEKISQLLKALKKGEIKSG